LFNAFINSAFVSSIPHFASKSNNLHAKTIAFLAHPAKGGMARLVRLRRSAFYLTIPISTFCESILDDLVKSLKAVTPAKAGVQNFPILLDSRFRGNDKMGKF